MTSLPPCPKCSSEYVYEDAGHLVCPECAHEWTPGEEVAHDEEKLVEGDPNIDCRIDGFGAMQLKSEFVKKL